MSVTRGHGLLERPLSMLRTKKAAALLPTRLHRGRILDIGCGSYPYFLSQISFEEKFGVDPVFSGKQPLKDAQIERFVMAEGSRLPFADDYFSAVTMLAVYEHIDRGALVSVVGEVRRVLAPGGRFVITTPAPRAEKVLDLLEMFRLVSEEELEEHQPLSSIKEIFSVLGGAGFERARIKGGFFEMGLNQWVYADM